MSTLYVDNLEPNLGSRVMAAGHVVQVVSSSNGDSWSTTSGSYVNIADMSVTITPTSATSKLLVTGHVSGAATNNARVSIFRDGANLMSTVTSRIPAIADFFEDQWNGQIHVRPFNFYIDASSTSATTIKAQVFTTGTFFLNKARDTADNIDRTNAHSTITVMEIAQ